MANIKQIPSVGIIGCGFVGTAFLNGFKYFTDVKAYDKFKRIHSWRHLPMVEVVQQDVLFVCVPTPEAEDGSCDTSIVMKVLKDISEISSENKPVLIKSTIPPEFCSAAQSSFENLEVIHSPEFLTQRLADIEFATQNRVILGRDEGVSPVVVELFEKVFLSIQVIQTTWKVAALLKYGLNTFFATKVSFFNELAQICEASGVDYEEVSALIRNDGRVHRHGIDVPGHDGKRGFGGACFPKDIKALQAIAKAVGVDPKVITAAIEKNSEVREPEKEDK